MLYLKNSEIRITRSEEPCKAKRKRRSTKKKQLQIQSLLEKRVEAFTCTRELRAQYDALHEKLWGPTNRVSRYLKYKKQPWARSSLTPRAALKMAVAVLEPVLKQKH